jgi:carbamate kinase
MASARESARQVGPLGSNSMIHSNNTSVLIESQEVLNQSKESIMNIYSKNVNTLAADHPQISSLYQEQSQTNRNKEPVLHDFR